MSANWWLRLKHEYQAVLHDKAAMRKFSRAVRDLFLSFFALIVIFLFLTSIWPAFEQLPRIFFMLIFTLIPLAIGLIAWKLRGGRGWWIALSLFLSIYLFLETLSLLDSLLKPLLKGPLHINIAQSASPSMVLLGILGVYGAVAFWRHWPLPNWAKKSFEQESVQFVWYVWFILLLSLGVIAMNVIS